MLWDHNTDVLNTDMKSLSFDCSMIRHWPRGIISSMERSLMYTFIKQLVSLCNQNTSFYWVIIIHNQFNHQSQTVDSYKFGTLELITTKSKPSTLKLNRTNKTNRYIIIITYIILSKYCKIWYLVSNNVITNNLPGTY